MFPHNYQKVYLLIIAVVKRGVNYGKTEKTQGMDSGCSCGDIGYPAVSRNKYYCKQAWCCAVISLGNIKGAKGDTGDTGAQGEKGENGRGIAKTEIIDGYLWVTYTDDLENPVNVGKVSENNNNECLKFTRLSDGTMSVSIKEDYKTFVKKVVIPSEYYGFKVTDIGKSGFSGCEMLEEVILPDTISSISDEAFYGCISLENIKLSVEKVVIGNNAFRGCSKLQ